MPTPAPLALATLSLALFLTACTAHEATPLLPLSDADVSAVVFGLRIAPGVAAKGRAKNHGCTVDLEDEDGEHWATLRGDESMRTERLRLPAGRYRFDHLSCGGTPVKTLARAPLPFDVLDDHISWLGDLDFRRVSAGAERWTLVYGDGDGVADQPDAESLGTAAEAATAAVDDGDGDVTADPRQPHDRPSLLKRLAGLPREVRRRVVSGYTGRSVPTAGARATKLLDATRFPPIASVSLGTLPARPINLDRCADDERARNVLVYGHWTMQVDYQSGHLAKLAVAKDAHLYSEAFVACVKAAIKRHKPGTPGLVSYEITL